ncbi:transcriptional regulator, LysR family [Andreprevotia lacus DSM 23236]|jgi:DNA-binding transcriptional LysR family regulator|uniref:Transcriptional regulator, LysR family n=1 Tax=Andreprevotia lacus DSM 23236 TaxID=1121001 RepID=A0A1W1XVF3_9NEIS|nr:LysR family transcriptional regulator [Andreprevotia lacus]SMC27531.1 transcriptional regulator, LysR family [Andreprevotia lacus DSM 23236]
MRTNDWNDWYVFATVAQLGSFTRAAARLELPKSSTSLAVARLEKKLGQRLLERSTRTLRLTEQGQALLDDIAPLFAQLDDVADGVTAQGDTPRGLLRIAAPYEFGMLQLGEAVCALMAQHAGLSIDVDVSSGPVDPLSAGYDITFAVTAQPLPDSSRVAKRVFSVARGLYAAPSLLRRYGQPADIAALAEWPTIANPHETEWQFEDAAGNRAALALAPRLRSPNAGLRLQATLAGLGASMIAQTYYDSQVKPRQLVQVLPHWQPDPLRVYAFMPARRLTPAKTRVFMDALEHWLRPPE